MMGKKDSLFISGSFYFLKIQKQEKKFKMCLIKEQYIENIQLTGYRESLNQGGVFFFKYKILNWGIILQQRQLSFSGIIRYIRSELLWKVLLILNTYSPFPCEFFQVKDPCISLVPAGHDH